MAKVFSWKVDRNNKEIYAYITLPYVNSGLITNKITSYDYLTEGPIENDRTLQMLGDKLRDEETWNKDYYIAEFTKLDNELKRYFSSQDSLICNSGEDVGMCAEKFFTIDSQSVFMLAGKNGSDGTNGKDGTSPAIIDLTNEMATVSLGEDYVLDKEVTVSTTVQFYIGSERQYNFQKSATTGNESIVTEWDVNDTSKLIITLKKNLTFTSESNYTFRIPIEVSATIAGQTYTAETTFNIVGVKGGKDGDVYRLLPSVNAITFDPNLQKYSVSEIECLGLLNYSPLSAEDYVIEASYGGHTISSDTVGDCNITIPVGTTLEGNGTPALEKGHGEVRFELKKRGDETIVYDRETIPIIEGGVNGTGSIKATLSNDYQPVAIGTDCILDVDFTATTTVTLYYGDEELPLASINCLVPEGISGVTASANTDTGVVEVSITSGYTFDETRQIPINITVSGEKGETIYNAKVTFFIVGLPMGEDGTTYKISCFPSNIVLDSNRRILESYKTVSVTAYENLTELTTTGDDAKHSLYWSIGERPVLTQFGEYINRTSEGLYQIDNGENFTISDTGAFDSIGNKLFVYLVARKDDTIALLDREEIDAIASGKDGIGSIVLHLSNDVEAIGTDGDKVLDNGPVTATTYLTATNGENDIVITSATTETRDTVPQKPNVALTITSVPVGEGEEEGDSKKKWKINVVVPAGYNFGDDGRFNVDITAYIGASSLVKTFTIIGVPAGADGKKIRIIPSVETLSFDRVSEELTPEQIDVTCYSDTDIIDPRDGKYSLTYSITYSTGEADKTEWFYVPFGEDATGMTFTFAKSTHLWDVDRNDISEALVKNVTFSLYSGEITEYDNVPVGNGGTEFIYPLTGEPIDESRLVDREEIPVIKDGKPGKDGKYREYIYFLSSEYTADFSRTKIEINDVQYGVIAPNPDYVSNYGPYQNPDFHDVKLYLNPTNTSSSPINALDDPGTVTDTTPYQYAMHREKSDDKWGPFSKPYLWTSLGKDGAPGLGMTYKGMIVDSIEQPAFIATLPNDDNFRLVAFINSDIWDKESTRETYRGYIYKGQTQVTGVTTGDTYIFRNDATSKNFYIIAISNTSSTSSTLWTITEMGSGASVIHQKYAKEITNGNSEKYVDVCINGRTVKKYLDFTDPESGSGELGETVGPYMGIYVDMKQNDSDKVKDYKWSKWGDDAFGKEQIYTTSQTLSGKPVVDQFAPWNDPDYSGSTQPDYVPTTAETGGVVFKDLAIKATSTNPFVWVCQRSYDKTSGKWTKFSKPKIYDYFSDDIIKLGLSNPRADILPGTGENPYDTTNATTKLTVNSNEIDLSTGATDYNFVVLNKEYENIISARTIDFPSGVPTYELSVNTSAEKFDAIFEEYKDDIYLPIDICVEYTERNSEIGDVVYHAYATWYLTYDTNGSVELKASQYLVKSSGVTINLTTTCSGVFAEKTPVFEWKVNNITQTGKTADTFTYEINDTDLNNGVVNISVTATLGDSTDTDNVSILCLKDGADGSGLNMVLSNPSCDIYPQVTTSTTATQNLHLDDATTTIEVFNGATNVTSGCTFYIENSPVSFNNNTWEGTNVKGYNIKFTKNDSNKITASVTGVSGTTKSGRTYLTIKAEWGGQASVANWIIDYDTDGNRISITSNNYALTCNSEGEPLGFGDTSPVYAEITAKYAGQFNSGNTFWEVCLSKTNLDSVRTVSANTLTGFYHEGEIVKVSGNLNQYKRKTNGEYYISATTAEDDTLVCELPSGSPTAPKYYVIEGVTTSTTAYYCIGITTATTSNNNCGTITNVRNALTGNTSDFKYTGSSTLYAYKVGEYVFVTNKKEIAEGQDGYLEIETGNSYTLTRASKGKQTITRLRPLVKEGDNKYWYRLSSCTYIDKLCDIDNTKSTLKIKSYKGILWDNYKTLIRKYGVIYREKDKESGDIFTEDFDLLTVHQNLGGSTGKSYRYQGYWENNKNYEVTSTSIDYVAYGVDSSTGNLKYWAAKKTNTGEIPSTGNTQHWEEFGSYSALATGLLVTRQLSGETISGETISAEDISAATAYFDELNASEISAGTITATTALLSGLTVSGTVNATTIEADHAKIENLTATTARIESLISSGITVVNSEDSDKGNSLKITSGNLIFSNGRDNDEKGELTLGLLENWESNGLTGNGVPVLILRYGDNELILDPTSWKPIDNTSVFSEVYYYFSLTGLTSVEELQCKTNQKTIYYKKDGTGNMYYEDSTCYTPYNMENGETDYLLWPESTSLLRPSELNNSYHIIRSGSEDNTAQIVFVTISRYKIENGFKSLDRQQHYDGVKFEVGNNVYFIPIPALGQNPVDGHYKALKVRNDNSIIYYDNVPGTIAQWGTNDFYIQFEPSASSAMVDMKISGSS